MPAGRPRATHCKRGHPLTNAPRNKAGASRCIECHNWRSALYWRGLSAISTHTDPRHDARRNYDQWFDKWSTNHV